MGKGIYKAGISIEVGEGLVVRHHVGKVAGVVSQVGLIHIKRLIQLLQAPLNW